MKKNNFIVSAIFGGLFLSLFIILGYVVIYKPNNFDIRNWATGSKLETRLINSSDKIKPDQAFTVGFEVNTKGKNYSGIQMAGTIYGADQDKSHLIVSQPTGLHPIFTNMSKDGENLKFKFIDFSTTTSPFNSNDSFIKLATLSLYPKRDGEIRIILDKNQSGGLEYGKEFNQSSIEQIAYNIEIDDGIGGTSAPPDQGIHRSCNEYCSDSRECDDQYSCYYNRCRNPKNITEESCADPIVIKPTPIVNNTVTATPQPKGGINKIEPTPTPTPATSSTIAKVIITSATISSTPISINPIPSASPAIERVKEATPTTRNVVRLNSNQPSPTPQLETPPSQKSSLLPILIGAAIIVGLGAIFVVIWFIKNIQNK